MNVKERESMIKKLIKRRQMRIAPERLIPLSFLIAIFLGTLLLMLPFATAEGESTGILTALFTATTSVCVTGLVVVDTYAHWSLFGQMVILLLIQIGGLGVGRGVVYVDGEKEIYARRSETAGWCAEY